MGAAADGWWRDRPAAVLRLLARLQCYARTADDRIRELLDEGCDEPVLVATSDRALAADVRSRGADVVGARTFLGRLDNAGC